MTDFRHWLDESSDADDFERAILRSGVTIEPPEGMQDEVWKALSSTLMLAPLVPASSESLSQAHHAAATSAAGAASQTIVVSLGVLKGFVVGLALYGAVSLGTALTARSGAPAPALSGPATPNTTEPRSNSSLGSAAAPSVSAEGAPLPARDSTGQPAPSRALPSEVRRALLAVSANASRAIPSSAAFSDASEQGSEGSANGVSSQLQAESAALRRARREMRSGDLEAAFATLEKSRRQIIAPALEQERETLTIELLQRSGQIDAARLRARAFISRFPESPHAAQLRQLVRE